MRDVNHQWGPRHAAALSMLLVACAVPEKYNPLPTDGPANEVIGRDAASVDTSSPLGSDAVLPPAADAGSTDVPASTADANGSEPGPVASADTAPDTSADASPPPVAWELASIGMGGAPANGSSSRGCLSADGRYVVFLSDASNLVPGDTNGLQDVFRFDRMTKSTERVNVSSEGAQADKAWSHPPSVSADGRYVVFISSATNLVPGDTNGTEDVFLRDMDTKRTTRVSVSSTGAQLAEQSAAGAISGDGSQIVFVTRSDNVLPNLNLSSSEAFIVNRMTGAILQVTQGASALFDAWISHDGTVLATLGYSPPEQAGSYYLHQVSTRQTTLAGKLGANVGSSVSASLSDDGRVFAFDTFGDPATGQGLSHGVYVLERPAANPIRISAMTGEGDTDSYGAYVSGDGQLVAFSARLQPRVLNRQTGALIRLPVPGGPAFITDLSRDGRFVAITTSSSMLPGASSGVTNLYVASSGR